MNRTMVAMGMPLPELDGLSVQTLGPTFTPTVRDKDRNKTEEGGHVEVGRQRGRSKRK